ncbi:benenodin family lasso peptide [Edaphosphingomonas haloaromaticamans]|uniref:Benenodin family lasso peptide n=1 Tax=Edaphosphingomonas haloaromaticamans TaxID=653954 RepID=A0A1S1HK92_9SPHN|nr:benenodin family lasso peptide [Sphingomonas haloaromaticamans]OHT21643.1 hypothetical protein BHE75_03654 [Sphingomonas haloaromaticamans]
MERNEEHTVEELIDLGSASVETKGEQIGAGESLGRFGQMGLSDD